MCENSEFLNPGRNLYSFVMYFHTTNGMLIKVLIIWNVLFLTIHILYSFMFFIKNIYGINVKPKFILKNKRYINYWMIFIFYVKNIFSIFFKVYSSRITECFTNFTKTRIWILCLIESLPFIMSDDRVNTFSRWENSGKGYRG